MAGEDRSGQLFGKYELLEKIGAGGMAEIYRARARGVEGFEKILCVKKILPVYAKNRAFIEMLVAEAKLSSLLQHANVVQIYDLGQQEGLFYIVMEYVHGCDLLQLLTACTQRKERIPTELALFVIAEVAKGLAYAHSATDRRGRPLNIIHRDVSPSNVLLSFDGDVKVVDFGVARADIETQEDEGDGKKSSALKGKLGYMSPELVTGGEIDHRSDIFALGIVLWETLTLRRLFLGKTDIQTLINIRDVKTDKKFAKHSYIDDGIYAIIDKALAKDPEERYQSAADMQEAILDYLFDARLRVTSRQLGRFIRDRVEDKVRAAPPAAKPAEGPPAAPEVVRAPEPPKPKPIIDAAVPSQQQAKPVAASGFEVEVEEDKTPVDEAIEARVHAIEGVDEPETEATDRPAPPPPPAQPPPPPSEEPFARASVDVLPPDLQYEGATYRVRSPDAGVFGPITYHNFQSLVRNRGITLEEYVSINDSPWIPLREVPIPGLDPQLFIEEPDQPLYEGPVSHLRTPQLLYELAIARVVGKLKFMSGTVLKEVYFQAGVPVHINSNIKSELLANFMLQRNLIGPQQLTAALGHVREHGGRLGDALVKLGLLKPHDLFRVVELQFRQRFLQLFGWTEGWYEFLEGYPPPGDVVPLNDGTVQLITAGVRTQFNMPMLREVFEDYLDQVLVIQQNPHITHHNLRFNSKELRFYTYLETGVTLRETLHRFGRSEDDQLTILQVILVLHQTDLLSFRSPRGFGRATA